ncbi:MAG: hypothetical protein M1436_09900 [Acidobacteria bacterium]|nr:hypothetical protein [Acidobacteriota bacterium]
MFAATTRQVKERSPGCAVEVLTPDVQGSRESIATVLEAGPDQATIRYWQAYLLREKSPAESRRVLARAAALSPYLVFPFRQESIPVFQWAAAAMPGDWKAKYYLALIHWGLGRNQEAVRMLQALGNRPDYAPAYVSRAFLEQRTHPASAQADYERAHALGADDWRNSYHLATFYSERGMHEKALKLALDASRRFPNQDLIKILLARSYRKQNCGRRDNWDLAVAVFIIPLTVQWWAVWYPGAEPGGGSYIAQRMLASKSEKDSLGGTLFFNLAHYILRPWPWILVGLASLIVYPQLSDIQKAFPNVDPTLVGHDIAFPAMLRFLPVGWMGLMVGGLVAANSSTILTHLNWGASYLVHDFYRRFITRDQSEKHYVMAGRLATIGLFVLSSGLTFVLETAQESFNIILQVGAGTGSIYLLRWFWWRVTAWCEIVAMTSSFAISVAFIVLRRHGIVLGTHRELLLTVLFTTLAWLITAYVGPKTERETLLHFYKKVHPFGPGWRHVRKAAGISEAEAALYTRQDNIPLAMLGWVAGTAVIWSGLFAVGNLLYGRMALTLGLSVVLVVSGSALIWVIRRLWK